METTAAHLWPQDNLPCAPGPTVSPLRGQTMLAESVLLSAVEWGCSAEGGVHGVRGCWQACLLAQTLVPLDSSCLIQAVLLPSWVALGQ